jgi:glutaredoxin
MRYIKVPGKYKGHKVLIYAISTCIWCKRAKKFLRDQDIEYKYVDIDQCNVEDRSKIKKDILARGGQLVYPTIIIDDKILINNFRIDKIRDALGI